MYIGSYLVLHIKKAQRNKEIKKGQKKGPTCFFNSDTTDSGNKTIVFWDHLSHTFVAIEFSHLISLKGIKREKKEGEKDGLIHHTECTHTHTHTHIKNI